MSFKIRWAICGFATDRGISKFDGKQFTTIDIESYLSSNVIFKFFKISNSKIWVSTDQNKLYWFNPCVSPHIFHPYKYNNVLSKKLNKVKNQFIRTLSVRDNGEILVTFKSRVGYLSIDKYGQPNLVRNYLPTVTHLNLRLYLKY